MSIGKKLEDISLNLMGLLATGAFISFVGTNVVAMFTSAHLESKLNHKTYQSMCVEENAPDILPYEAYSKDHGNEEYNGIISLKAPDKDFNVTIIGMTHVANQRFYDEVFELYQENDIILEEGVDMVNVSESTKKHPVYKLFSDVLTLYDDYAETHEQATQHEYLEDLQNQETSEIISQPEYVWGDASFDVIADSITTPAEKTYWTLLNVSKMYNFYSMLLTSSGHPTYMSYALICPRNDVLEDNLIDLYNSMEEKESLFVAVPWGADHGPDIVGRLVLEHGFTIESTDYLQATYSE
jgi:hypothetical protein